MLVEEGKIVDGKVSGITKFGAFIELPEGKTGLVHISEVAEEYVTDIKAHLTENQDVKVKIMSIDPNGKISLSIRKALPKKTFQDNIGPYLNSCNDYNTRGTCLTKRTQK